MKYIRLGETGTTAEIFINLETAKTVSFDGQNLLVDGQQIRAISADWWSAIRNTINKTMSKTNEKEKNAL